MAKKKLARKKNVAGKKKTSHKVVRAIPKTKQLPMPVQVKPEQLCGNYCNRAMFTHSQREFVFDFIFSLGESAVLVSRIITNPQHAKQIHQVLGKNIGDYEKKFGKIVLK